GILLGASTNNTILNNSAYNNVWRGIYLSSSSNNNTIFNNSLSYNKEGIFVSDSHNNTIRRNNADHNENGMWVWDSNNTDIIGNSLSYNDLIGLYLRMSNNTDVIGNTFIGNLYKNIDEFESENNFFKWNYLDGIFSPFVIDNNGGGDFKWTEAKNLFFWCTGSGSYSDPYIMNNLIIDGQNSSSCIEIRDSMVFFKIEGCTLSNSGSGVYNAGIKLSNVINGQLIDNYCSNNNGVGIGLYQSQNITIDGNIANNNVEFGIFLEVSHNNILSGNTLNENSNGMYLGLSTNNTISENSAFNNVWRGIYLSSLSNNNTIMNNNVTYNSDNGIDIYDSHDIKVIGNIADNNGWNGIFVWECNSTTVARNIANYNTFAGLYLWSSNNTEVIGNVFIGNLHSIYESDCENNIFNWNVDNGFTTSIIIDDSGTGDFTWVESVNQLAWIYGSGTSIDPYIIELITIDGLNLTSCLTIRNSNVYFKIQNCTFYNSGYNLNDGGIKLISTINGELIYNNCSFNRANGIILDSCQSIIITENSINNNELSGIVLIDSNNIDIINNKETINFNDLYGIHLFNSHYNNITSNTITNNLIGIFLDQSNYNYIDWNNLLDNDQAIVDNGIGNDLGPNNVLPGGPIEFPFDILIIVLIIGLAVVGVTGAAIIIKKKISIPVKKEKEISEKKKEKVRIKLEAKLAIIDNYIKENNFKSAYKNLGKVKDTAEQYEFFDIFNKANKKVEICKEKEEGISGRVIEEGIAPSVKEREAKVIVPVIKKEEDLRYNLFISYSTSDRDYFQIKRIVKELKKYPKINQVSYWERDSKANIVEFMDKTLEVSNTFVLFCSENSLKSNAVKDEWQAAFQMRKQGLIKLIPVYEEQEHIPKLLWHLLNVKYNQDDFKGFIENLYKEIIRG
ncbi:MAG: NosD domain-containing protein, partial [Candidatus Lokiarchaeia archaeon]